MRLSLSMVGAAVALALASASAMATSQADIPPQPVAGPLPVGNTGNGGLVVAAWDGTKSIVQYLGLGFLDVEKADITTTGSGGIHLDFGTLSLWGSTFTNPSAVTYAVYAVDNARAGNLGATVSTTIADPSSLVGAEEIIGDGAQSFSQKVATYAEFVFNSALECNGANPCVAPAASSARYAGDGQGLGSDPTSLGLNISASVGTAMQFFSLAGTSAASDGTISAYSAAGRVGSWLLTAAGNLTYDFPADGGGPPVPLPAGVWLLISGLTGLGVMGRRGKRAAVAA